LTTVTFTSSGSWSAPAGVIQIDCQCWGEGGTGATALVNSHSGGGAGGGEFAEETTLAVTALGNYSYTIGSGGTGTNTSFPGDSVTVLAAFGSSPSGINGGIGGNSSSNTIHHAGGGGGLGATGTSKGGAGGGSSAGTGSAGNTGSNAIGSGGASGGSAPSGGGAGGNGGASNAAGSVGSVPGGGGGGGGDTTSSHAGGVGATGQVTLTYFVNVAGTATLSGVGTLTTGQPLVFAPAQPYPSQIAPGQTWLRRFGYGMRHQVRPGNQVQTITAGAVSLAGVGTMVPLGGLPNPVVVNQWANNYGQGTTFGSITSALQSCVVQLAPAFSVGVGSGVATAGNWLFAIASWTQTPQIANVHAGVSDDTHQWWRQYPASGSGQNVRTSISYVPNIGTGSTNSVVPQYVYCAPDGPVAAVNVLIIEVSGLGPWDTVAGTNTNYTSSGTSVSLSLGAPAQASFFIGGVGGDNVASGQAFAPAGYTALATQTQTNGTDRTCDNILTSAFRASSNSSQSVSGTSSSSENLSGFLLGVYVGAQSPVPASQNPNWPYSKVEVAFGAGFNTPESELTWTDLTNRLWSWDERTGIQFQLGQIQATSALLELDNFDGALLPSPSTWSFTASGTPLTSNYFIVTTAQSASIIAGDGFTDTTNPGTFFVVQNVGAPFAGFVNVTFTPSATSVMASPDVVSQANLVSGVPIRLRMALATMGGQVINRWQVIRRNVHEVQEEINSAYRRYIPLTVTDLWASMSSVPPTFYRSEIYQDNPGWWWPMDDQPLEGGVLPTTLLNAAGGSTTVMNIVASPSGVTAQGAYGANGSNLTASNFAATGGVPPPAVATYAVGANTGWMYGDPPSSSSSFSSATGNPVESSAGSASWQQSGLLGNTGSNGWFLSVADTFPGLSSGITVKGWFNCGFYGSAVGFGSNPGSYSQTDTLGQPHAAITVCTLTTNSAPVAVLQLDTSGHLNLITYNGATGTSHSIYSASDLRSSAWISVDMTLTTTTWNVLVNGGLTANVSGSATGMTSAWTYLILAGDMGASGGASPSSIQHGGNIAYSHWVVFSYILPTWRLLAHYTAAISGFGLLPAPIVQLQAANAQGTQGVGTNSSILFSATPDGWLDGGSYGGTSGQINGGSGDVTTYSVSMLMTANAGAYSSGPSARTVLVGQGAAQFVGADSYAFPNAVWAALSNPDAPLYTIYTSAAAANETAAATILGAGDTFTSGFGASAVDQGVAQVGGGTGAAPPVAATPLGDTVGQRIERLMRAGRTTSPQRSIDPSAPLVQAPGNSGGGVQTGTAVQAIQQGDSGLLFVDNVGMLTYWMRSHLASQYSIPVWKIGPTTTSGEIPYYREVRWVTDPQRIYNVITVQPFSPTGAQLPSFTPANASGVLTSQVNYGAQPLAVTSWLQDQSEMQLQANWLFTNFGQPQRRAENVRIDAAPYPAAWNLVAGVNVGDVVTMEDWQVGGGGNNNTYRVTEINRKIRFGGMNDGNAGEGIVVASVELILDAEPASYWG